MNFKKNASKLILVLPLLASVFAVSGCKKEDRRAKAYKVCEELNTYIDQIKYDGTLDEIESIWLGNDESKKVIDYSSSGKNGKLTFASVLQAEPMGYLANGKPVGYSTDIIYRFGKEYGYDIELLDCNTHSAAVAAVVSGKADFGGSYCSITDERLESVCFSDSYYVSDATIMVTNETWMSLSSIDDLKTAKWGVASGSSHGPYINQKYPDATVSEYSNVVDCTLALSEGKVDAVVTDKPIAEYLVNKGVYPNVVIYKGFGIKDDFGFIFPQFFHQSLNYYAKKRIGCVLGGVDDMYVWSKLPDVQIFYYPSMTDCTMALNANKIDAYVDETPSFTYLKRTNNQNYARVNGILGTGHYGYIFPRNSEGLLRRNDFNVFLSEINESGKLDELRRKWIDGDNPDLEIDYHTLEGSETLVYCTAGTYSPFNMIKNNDVSGFEVDIVTLYAKSRGLKLQVELNEFSGILAGIDRYDLASCLITETAERAESLYFSDSYYSYESFLVTKAGGMEENFFKQVGDSFYSTFVVEQRWKLFFEGLGTTLEITLLSIAFGSLLGFGIFFLIKKSKVGKTIFSVCDYILTGMPVVVLLMIFYYIFFGKSSISSIIVAIIVFSLLFSCSMVKSLRLGVNNVPNSQTEASLALGYRENHAFFRFVLPQALDTFLSSFKGEAVSLLKATAIVGYIAIQDLTKVTDIVRSRTYEAFFPLITLALIYFGVAFLMAFFIERIQIVINPKRRKPSKILKGVDTHEN